MKAATIVFNPRSLITVFITAISAFLTYFKRRAVFNVVCYIVGFISLVGCDTQRSCFLSSEGTGTYDVSPSGRAVAFVNSGSYARIREASGNIDLDCIIAEFWERFENEPLTLVVVLDFESPKVSKAQNKESHKIRLNAFNHFLRDFAEGIGHMRKNPNPIGPPNMRTVVFLPYKEDLISGRFLHEYGHNWGASLDGPKVLLAQISGSGGHWGYSSVGGILGGWFPGTLVEIGELRYRTERIAPAGWSEAPIPYAPLELYLMGLLKPQEVPSIKVAVEPKVHNTDRGVEFSVKSLQEVTIEEIVKANGPRVPAMADAPKNFSLTLLILADHELTTTEWDFYERAMDFMSAPSEITLEDFFPKDLYPAHHSVWGERATASGDEFGYRYQNFSKATGGLATLEFVAPVER